MPEFPFSLLFKRTSSKNEGETVLCKTSLRTVPGKRQVFDAEWADRAVIAKVFSHPFCAKRHMKKEWQGLKRVQKLGLSCPAALFYGKTEQGHWAVVMEKIMDAPTVRQILDNTTEPSKKTELLSLVFKELAKQHSKGILQKDLHLGNFLLHRQKLFTLDPAQMRLFPNQIGRKQSIAQMALLASQLPDSETEIIPKLCDQYAQLRLWQFDKSDMALFWKQLAIAKKVGVKRGLKKCLRTSKRCIRIKQAHHRGVAGRDFYQAGDFSKFAEKIDELMRAGQILKNGNTCFVSRLAWADKDIVVKRYNYKGFIHCVRHTIKRSRAPRSWLHAHRLLMLNIPTPKPLTYIEKCKGPLILKSYFVTEYIQGQKLYDFLRDGNITEEKRSKVTQQMLDLFEQLQKNKISHGDLKHSNILITDSGPVLTDLDGMKVHKWNWLCRCRFRKDLKRFGKVKELPSADAFFSKKFGTNQ